MFNIQRDDYCVVCFYVLSCSATIMLFLRRTVVGSVRYAATWASPDVKDISPFQGLDR